MATRIYPPNAESPGVIHWRGRPRGSQMTSKWNRVFALLLLCVYAMQDISQAATVLQGEPLTIKRPWMTLILGIVLALVWFIDLNIEIRKPETDKEDNQCQT